MQTNDIHINKIPLGNDVYMEEFFLEPGFSAPIPAERNMPTEKTGEMERLVSTYHGERFLEIGGRKIPAIFEGAFKLYNIEMQTLEGSFEPAARFRTAINARRKKALDDLLKRGGHDGRNVSVRDWYISRENVMFIGQAMNYTQFRSTDAVQDAPLSPDDPTFPQKATLRDYVVVNGMESRRGTDILSNLLGAAFIVRANGRDGQRYFVLGRRQKGRTSEGGELSVIGGTPMWEDEYFGQGKADFAGYMRKLGAEEQGEELLLKPDEIEVGNNVFLIRTLVRSFDPFYTVDVDPKLSVQDITQRCYGNAEALKEHDRLYALPRTEEALHGLLNNNRGFSVGQGTLAGLKLALDAEK